MPDADWKPYRELDLGADCVPKDRQPWATKKTERGGHRPGLRHDREHRHQLRPAAWPRCPDNTIVIFLTDNGPGGRALERGPAEPQGDGLRGRHPRAVLRPLEGPVRRLGAKVDTAGGAHRHHADAPRAVRRRSARKASTFDGRSFCRCSSGEKVDWPDRHLFFQWHRGDVPEMCRAFAARGPRYKLVQAAGVQVGKYDAEVSSCSTFRTTRSSRRTSPPRSRRSSANLRAEYEAWFADVKSTRNFAAPRIDLGIDEGEGRDSDATGLARAEGWLGAGERGPLGRGGREGRDVPAHGAFSSRARRTRNSTFSSAEVLALCRLAAEDGTSSVVDIRVPTTGETKLEVWVEGDKRVGANFLTVEKVGD